MNIVRCFLRSFYRPTKQDLSRYSPSVERRGMSVSLFTILVGLTSRSGRILLGSYSEIVNSPKR